MTTPHHYVPANRSTSGNNYMKFGSGLVDAYAAANLINNNQFYTGYLTTSETIKTHNLVVNTTDIGKTFRVSLVVQKHSSESYSLPNLDLEIKAPAGTVLRTSTTINNIEICEFTPAVSGTYTINVKKISAPSVNSYFAVAWSKS